jgi:hypothetical protein
MFKKLKRLFEIKEEQLRLEKMRTEVLMKINFRLMQIETRMIVNEEKKKK